MFFVLSQSFVLSFIFKFIVTNISYFLLTLQLFLLLINMDSAREERNYKLSLLYYLLKYDRADSSALFFTNVIIII